MDSLHIELAKFKEILVEINSDDVDVLHVEFVNIKSVLVKINFMDIIIGDQLYRYYRLLFILFSVK